MIKALGGILIIFSLLAGCFHADDPSLDSQCDALIDTFFRKSDEVQMAKFSAYPLEKKYVVFICGNQVIHPPRLYLAGMLAQEGAEVVDFLKDKLKKTSGDLTIRDIIYVFSEMDRLGTYDIADDDELVTLLANSVNRMKTDWKTVTEKTLRGIVSQETKKDMTPIKKE